ncbi:MAG: hypothetical protein ACREMR_06185 [Gemmatimonadales bacterium]
MTDRRHVDSRPTAMHRHFWAFLVTLPATVAAQDAAGTALWRLASTTLAVPPALATGGPAALWNAAQPDGTARLVLSVELLRTPPELGVAGPLAAGRVQVRTLGAIGLVYGRLAIDDLVRTSDSPEPTGGSVPYYTQIVGAHWARAIGRATVGALLAHHDTRLDAALTRRWTLDLGVRAPILSDALEVAAATHFFSWSDAGDPAQDLYLGLAYRVPLGQLWEGSERAALSLRYGAAVAHGFGADQFVGAGMALGEVFTADVMIAREGGYAEEGWRPVGAIRVGVGRYRVSFARDAGTNGIGSAYRVGLEVRAP